MARLGAPVAPGGDTGADGFEEPFAGFEGGAGAAPAEEVAGIVAALGIGLPEFHQRVAHGVAGAVDHHALDPDALARLAAALDLPQDAVQLEPQHLSPGRLRVRVPAGGSVTGDDVARHLLNERLVEDLAITHASLDDVFLSLTDAGRPAPSEPQEALA